MLLTTLVIAEASFAVSTETNLITCDLDILQNNAFYMHNLSSMFEKQTSNNFFFFRRTKQIPYRVLHVY